MYFFNDIMKTVLPRGTHEHCIGWESLA